MWASVVVRSRSIGIPDDGAPFPPTGALADAVRGDGPRPRGFALVPFLDFANHDDAEDNAKLCQFDDAAGGVGLVATRPVAEGDEIRFNYRPDEHLRGFYRSYGFVPARPPRQIYDVDDADDAEAADRRVAARRWPPKGAVTVLDVDARPPGVAAAARTCEDRGSRVVVRRADAGGGGGDDAAARARAVALLGLALRAARREPGGGDAADAYRAASAAILEEALADLVRVERVGRTASSETSLRQLDGAWSKAMEKAQAPGGALHSYYNNPTARQKRRKIVQTAFLHHKAERLASPFADLKTPTTAMNDRAPLLLSEEQWPIALGSVARRDSSKTETMTRVVGLQRENARGAVEYAPVPGGGAPGPPPAHWWTKSDLEQASVLLGMKLSPVPSPAPSPKRRKVGFPPDDQPAAVSRSGSSDSAELLAVDLVPRRSTAPPKKTKKAEDLPKPPHGCGVREATLAGFARVPDAPAGLVERSARFVSEVACMFPPGSTIFSLFKRFLAAPRTCVDDRKRAVKEIILLLNETPQLMKLFLGLLPPESYAESVRSHDVQSLVKMVCVWRLVLATFACVGKSEGFCCWWSATGDPCDCSETSKASNLATSLACVDGGGSWCSEDGEQSAPEDGEQSADGGEQSAPEDGSSSCACRSIMAGITDEWCQQSDCDPAFAAQCSSACPTAPGATPAPTAKPVATPAPTPPVTAPNWGRGRDRQRARTGSTMRGGTILLRDQNLNGSCEPTLNLPSVSNKIKTTHGSALKKSDSELTTSWTIFCLFFLAPKLSSIFVETSFDNTNPRSKDQAPFRNSNLTTICS
ncbi:hypothetical protein AURANDRAFT_72420 [Aureococcus anophagefferens]|uniref:Uncharacterized protein n=1 Tax=Aureococcus anophagefferens TaxID=44056 RepID=F0YJ55_AURAN|nr:hypothetical protein AURANDRAFT_72420 [Aureococcus anophagefferens]EGB04863.1 hypothetical protein AURANDRAFT_72420 [Aureococcus anophagefferens]|eukprot:XP_009040420.1 hypothetical protein AURANDRAFT_72420 [Aureococcus anophagefferens]